MLTEICARLRNYFASDSDIYTGVFSISGGMITPPVPIQDGQYYRIVGSVFNDGVHLSSDILQDEEPFEGGVWLMRVPQGLIALDQEMEEWLAKYGNVESPNMSPYSSESFGGYTYSKAQGYASSGGGMLNSVWAVFDSRLSMYRKIRVL